MTAPSSLSCAPQFSGARRLLGVLVRFVGLSFVLVTAAWTTPGFFGRGIVILPGAIYASGTRR
jgi:hypothetical protein